MGLHKYYVRFYNEKEDIFITLPIYVKEDELDGFDWRIEAYDKLARRTSDEFIHNTTIWYLFPAKEDNRIYEVVE